MDSVLQGLDFLFVYLDNILVASKDQDDLRSICWPFSIAFKTTV